jgi:hypothetical protein
LSAFAPAIPIPRSPCFAANGDHPAADDAFAHAATAIDSLRRGGRSGEATLAEAFHHSVKGRPDQAIGSLRALLNRAELPFTGWTIPIEPLFDPVRHLAEFRTILDVLAERAR